MKCISWLPWFLPLSLADDLMCTYTRKKTPTGFIPAVPQVEAAKAAAAAAAAIPATQGIGRDAAAATTIQTTSSSLGCSCCRRSLSSGELALCCMFNSSSSPSSLLLHPLMLLLLRLPLLLRCSTAMQSPLFAIMIFFSVNKSAKQHAPTCGDTQGAVLEGDIHREKI